MRIAIFCHNYPPHVGGLETVVSSMVSELGRDHQVTVVTSAFGDAAGRSNSGNILEWRLPVVRLLEYAGVPFPIPYGPNVLAAMADVGKPDLIICHGALYPTTLLACSASYRAGCPMLLTEHVGFVAYRSAVLNAMQRLAWATIGRFTIRRAHGVTAMNKSVADFVRTVAGEGDVTLIPNGVNSASFRPRGRDERLAIRRKYGFTEQKPVVLVIARDAAKKNVEEALRLVSADYVLAVCGARREIHLHGVLDLGVVPHAEMPALIASCDVLFHPATGEGFPVCVQEAMASGTPVVLRWDNGYAASVDRNLVASYIGDDGERTLRKLLDDEGERARLSRDGCVYARRFWDWGMIVERYLTLFRQVRGNE